MSRVRMRVSEERVAAGLPTPETLVAACNMLGDCKNFQVRRETSRIREYIREYSLKKKPTLMLLSSSTAPRKILRHFICRDR